MNPARLAAAGVLGLVVLAPALFAAAGGANGTSVSPALADAPAGLVTVAFEAGQLTGIDGNVLLAIAKVECDYGRCRSGQPDDLVPDDLRAHVDAAALQPGGATAVLLWLPDGRRIGDWVNPQPVADGEHAMGLMQFLPSTWRTEAAVAPGGPSDPYRPADALLTAGHPCLLTFEVDWLAAWLEAVAAGEHPGTIFHVEPNLSFEEIHSGAAFASISATKRGLNGRRTSSRTSSTLTSRLLKRMYSRPRPLSARNWPTTPLAVQRRL